MQARDPPGRTTGLFGSRGSRDRFCRPVWRVALLPIRKSTYDKHGYNKRVHARHHITQTSRVEKLHDHIKRVHFDVLLGMLNLLGNVMRVTEPSKLDTTKGGDLLLGLIIRQPLAFITPNLKVVEHLSRSITVAIQIHNGCYPNP